MGSTRKRTHELGVNKLLREAERTGEIIRAKPRRSAQSQFTGDSMRIAIADIFDCGRQVTYDFQLGLRRMSKWFDRICPGGL